MAASEILVIRSASFQQLDKNLPAVAKAFPEATFVMLTHEHGLKLAEKYKMFTRIYTYPFKGSFTFRRPVSELQRKSFDALIIPVANMTGAGFFNVLAFSLNLRTKKRFVCNLVSELREITVPQIVWMGMKAALGTVAAAIITGILLLPTILFLLFNLRAMTRQRR